jgi:hypothetical protein
LPAGISEQNLTDLNQQVAVSSYYPQAERQWEGGVDQAQAAAGLPGAQQVISQPAEVGP